MMAWRDLLSCVLLLALVYMTRPQGFDANATSPESNREQLMKYLDLVNSFVEGLDDFWKPLPAHTYASYPFTYTSNYTHT
ncbi:hypothetical protein EON65_16570, partial [archaeon]